MVCQMLSGLWSELVLQWWLLGARGGQWRARRGGGPQLGPEEACRAGSAALWAPPAHAAGAGGRERVAYAAVRAGGRERPRRCKGDQADRGCWSQKGMLRPKGEA